MTDRATVNTAMCADEVVAQLHINRMALNRLTRSIDLPFARQVGRGWVYWPEDVAVLRATISVQSKPQDNE